MSGAVSDPEEAAEHVRGGGLLAYPTETVWGLGADAASAEAVARLRAWKGREADRPIAVLVADAAALPGLGLAVPEAAWCLAHAFWPGPLTLVLPAGPGEAGRFAPGVARQDGAVGVRCSPHPAAAALARALARAGAGPATATSLNRSGEPPAASAAAAARLCAERRPGDPAAPRLMEIGAAPVSSAAPSTVVDCTGGAGATAAVRVIREGAIAAPALAAAVAGDDPGPDRRRGPDRSRPSGPGRS